MYSLCTFTLLISATFVHSWLGEHKSFNFSRPNRSDAEFSRLSRQVNGSDALVQASCTQHNYRRTVTSGDGYYILKYYLDNIIEDSVVIKIERGVIYVTVNLGDGTFYKNLYILPNNVLVEGALWNIIDGHLNVIMGSSLWSGVEVELTCASTSQTFINVPKAPLSPEDL